MRGTEIWEYYIQVIMEHAPEGRDRIPITGGVQDVVGQGAR